MRCSRGSTKLGAEVDAGGRQTSCLADNVAGPVNVVESDRGENREKSLHDDEAKTQLKLDAGCGGAQDEGS